MMKKKQKDRDLESLSKDGLEKQKLKTEIRELERKWWKNPAYLTVLIPIILAISGAFFTYYQTVTSKERIENERLEVLLTELMKTQNAYRLESLEAKENDLKRTNIQLSDSNKRLSDENKRISETKDKEIDIKKEQLKIVSGELDGIKKDIGIHDSILAESKKENNKLIEDNNKLGNLLNEREKELNEREADLNLRELINNYYDLAINIIWLTIPQKGFTAKFLFKRDTDDADILKEIDGNLDFFNIKTSRAILEKYNLVNQHDRFIIEIDKYLGDYSGNGVGKNLDFFNEKLHPKWDRIIEILNMYTKDKNQRIE